MSKWTGLRDTVVDALKADRLVRVSKRDLSIG